MRDHRARLPLILSATCGALLLALIIRDAGNASRPEPLRIPVDRSPQALVRLAPGDGERVDGALALAWEPRSGALAYRVVVLEPDSGRLLAVDAGGAAGVDIPARAMSEAFGRQGTHDLWWTVAVRRLDGEERISAPGRLAWSADGP